MAYRNGSQWLYKEIKKGKPVLKWKGKPVLKWKGSIVALKDFFKKKIRRETNWNYIEAGPKKPATWRLKESGFIVVWYPSTNTLCFQGEEGDRIKSTVLSMLDTEELSQHEYEDDSSNYSELSNFSITDPPCLFPDTPVPNNIESSMDITNWNELDREAAEALLQLRTIEQITESPCFSARERIPGGEHFDKNSTSQNYPEIEDKTDQKEENKDTSRISLLLDLLSEENMKYKKL